MATISVELPSLLHGCTKGQKEVAVEASTVQGAIEQLLNDYPLLKNNLFEVNGARRKHVMIFFNEQNVDWLENLNHPVTTSDRLIIVQAVAGG